MKYGNPIRQCRGYSSECRVVLRLYHHFFHSGAISQIKLQLYIMCCFVANKNPLETVQYGVEGSTTFLECQARSPHMSLKWHVQKENSDRRKEVSTALILNLL